MAAETRAAVMEVVRVYISRHGDDLADRLYITIEGTQDNRFSGDSLGLAVYAALAGWGRGYDMFFEGAFVDGILSSVGGMAQKLDAIMSAGASVVWVGDHTEARIQSAPELYCNYGMTSLLPTTRSIAIHDISQLERAVAWLQMTDLSVLS
jgi:predicted S18 family serine protease